MKAVTLLLLMLQPCLAQSSTFLELSAEEKQEVQTRLKNFYARPKDGSVMNLRQPKYDPQTGKQIELHPYLRSSAGAKPNTLEWLAGKKGTNRFQKEYKKYLFKKFPDMAAEGNDWAALEKNDRVENLTKSWVTQPTYDLDSIPWTGESALPLWSDDYWPMKYGLTSLRYAIDGANPPFRTYQEAVSSYSQPSEWATWLGLPLADIAARVINLSPSEKYDLSLGDETFSLTHEQKGEGAHHLNQDGDVEFWAGICHGWASASIMSPRPIRAVKLIGARGIPVEWYPSDIRAMATLAWANGDFASNRIGGRCEKKAQDVQTYPNGRIKDQSCFDENPSTFHLALGNMIGRARGSFIMDKAFDYEVWNQPIHSYDFTYFNPLDSNRQSKNWREVVVRYDDNFKIRDRFQAPLTRGVRTPNGYSDEKVRYVVGVIATVTFLAEVFPTPSRQAGNDRFARETYTYDLELYEYHGRFYPQGGEWHENAHPDFLWVPQKNSVALLDFDDEPYPFNGIEIPAETTTKLARGASAEGYPLCKAVKTLVETSSGVGQYRCQ